MGILNYFYFYKCIRRQSWSSPEWLDVEGEGNFQKKKEGCFLTSLLHSSCSGPSTLQSACESGRVSSAKAGATDRKLSKQQVLPSYCWRRKISGLLSLYDLLWKIFQFRARASKVHVFTTKTMVLKLRGKTENPERGGDREPWEGRNHRLLLRLLWDKITCRRNNKNLVFLDSSTYIIENIVTFLDISTKYTSR